MRIDTVWAGGSPAAGHFSCAAKKSNQKKAAPGVAPLYRGVSLCCLTRQGGCVTRPGEAHTTRLTAGLEQVLAETPLPIELHGASKGENCMLRLNASLSLDIQR
jgi:hypothetical protein